MHKSIEWAAGLFEGEGCISTSTTKYGKTRHGLYLGGKDKDVIEAFAAVMPYGNIHKREAKRKDFHSDIYMWQVFAKDKVRVCLDMLLPYLGDRRAHKALDVLDDLELS